MLHHHLLAAPEQHLQAAGFILRGIRGVLAIIGSVIAGVICAAPDSSTPTASSVRQQAR